MKPTATGILPTIAAMVLAVVGFAFAQAPEGAKGDQRATLGSDGSIRFGETNPDEPQPPLDAEAKQEEKRADAPGASAIRPSGFDPYAQYRPNWRRGYWGGRGLSRWAYRYPEFQEFGDVNGIFLWPGYRDFVGGGYHGMGPDSMLSSMFSRWGYGSWLNRLGYSTYTNPYYAADLLGQGQSPPYDYSRPIDTTAEPQEEAKARPALNLFDKARDQFKRGNYNEAGELVDEALKLLPDDATLHEFRALCLFAVGRYDEAAAALYAVLSVSPGWDWKTLVGFYPEVDVYTEQLRALEAHAKNHESAHAWFVLGYFYLSQDAFEEARTVLTRAVKLNPKDDLSARLLGHLDASMTKAESEPKSEPEPPEGASITGSWTAKPKAGGEVLLTINDDGGFTWTATQAGQSQAISGKSSTYKDGQLALKSDQGPTLIGRVSWTDPTHMTFRIAGDGPDDPGLSFAK